MLKLFFSQTDLASGGCMGNFRWDGGAKRKFLDESLPTDSAVIIFFFFYSNLNRKDIKLNFLYYFLLGGDALPGNLS